MITQSWDTAIKAGNSHDYSVCATFEMRKEEGEGAGKYTHRLLDVFLGRFEYPQLKRSVVRQAEQYQTEAILIEDKASGQSLIQDLKRESSLPIIAIMPKGDKITRFAQVTPMIEAGLVALPKQASWLAGFEQEILRFPNASYDDQVDAFSQYLNWIRQKQWGDVQIRHI